MSDIHPRTPVEIAAQLWCLPQHSHKVMDVHFAESIAAELDREQRLSDAWMETARQHHKNEEFYRGIVTQIGEMFGDAAKTSDDGTLQQDVLALKVPELVRAMLASVAVAPT